MPDCLTVKKPVDYNLKVYSPNDNYILFEIAGTEVVKKLQLIIDIPCGKTVPGETYLCADANRAKLTIRSEPMEKLKFLTQPATAKTVSWKSSTFSLNAAETVAIRITGFNPELAGNASLRLRVVNPDVLHDETYAVSVAPNAGVAVIYFDVSPASVVEGDEVTISSTTSGANTVKLYAGETEVRGPQSSELMQTWTVNKYTHKARLNTSVYRLKAWQGQPRDNDAADALVGQFVQREITVAVADKSGWYPWDLLSNSLEGDKVGKHYYPTLLLQAKDLSGETVADKVYGIFVCKETNQAELWSSNSGVDDWSFLADVPKGMGESPGVIHKEALWLIGGSSANPVGPASNRVCWYYKNKNNEMVWKEWDAADSERNDPAVRTPAPRRCHACAVFNGKIWVMGGLSGLPEQDNMPLDDVWTCSADPTNGNFTPVWEELSPLPSARCMFTAEATPATTKINGINEPRLWIYGGTTHPYNIDEIFDELLWTKDGKVWIGSKDLHGVKVPGDKKGVPLGATLLFGNGELNLLGRFQSPSGGLSMSVHSLGDVTRANPGWADVFLGSFGWDFPRTDLFLMRSMSFRKRWIFWLVYYDIAAMTEYRARIYNT